MKDKIKIFISKFVQVLGVVFGVLGAVSVFLPLADATPSNAWGRIGILIGLVVVIAIISIIWTGVEIRKTSNTIYSKGKTKFIFEYNDIEKMFENEDDEGRIFVININNDLDIVGDKVILDKAPKSVHAAFLRYLNTKSVSVSKELLSKVQSKPDINIDEKGRIGDWFIVNDDALGIETKNQFLLLEVNNMSEDIKHNRVLDPLTKKDYYMCVGKIFTYDQNCRKKMKDDQVSIYFSHGSVGLKDCTGMINLPDDLDYCLTASDFFAPIDAREYFTALLLAFMVVPIVEIVKLIQRKTNK